MKYDFETVINRSKVGSPKWAFMKRDVPEIPDDVVPFSVADMELKNAPEIMEGLREFLQDDKINLGYSIPTPSYTQAISDWMQRRHGWEIDASWIVMSLRLL